MTAQPLFPTLPVSARQFTLPLLPARGGDRTHCPSATKPEERERAAAVRKVLTEARTQKEVASLLGCSKQAVSKIEQRAFVKIIRQFHKLRRAGLL